MLEKSPYHRATFRRSRPARRSAAHAPARLRNGSFCLVAVGRRLYRSIIRRMVRPMAKFSTIFSTERLLQIILVLTATVIMKLFS